MDPHEEYTPVSSRATCYPLEAGPQPGPHHYHESINSFQNQSKTIVAKWEKGKHRQCKLTGIVAKQKAKTEDHFQTHCYKSLREAFKKKNGK